MGILFHLSSSATSIPLSSPSPSSMTPERNITPAKRPRGRPTTKTRNRYRVEPFPTRQIQPRPPPNQNILPDPNIQGQDSPGIYSWSREDSQQRHIITTKWTECLDIEVFQHLPDMTGQECDDTWSEAPFDQSFTPGQVATPQPEPQFDHTRSQAETSWSNSPFDYTHGQGAAYWPNSEVESAYTQAASYSPYPQFDSSYAQETPGLQYGSPPSQISRPLPGSQQTATPTTSMGRTHKRPLTERIDKNEELILFYSALYTTKNRRGWVDLRVLMSLKLERSFTWESTLCMLGNSAVRCKTWEYQSSLGLLKTIGFAEVTITLNPDPSLGHTPFRLTALVLPGSPPAEGVDLIIGKLDLEAAYNGMWNPQWTAPQYVLHGTGKGYNTLKEMDDLRKRGYKGRLCPPSDRVSRILRH